LSRIIVYTVLAVASAAALLFVKDPTVVGLLTGITTGLVIPVIDIWVNHPYGPNIMVGAIRFRRTEVRVSVSYLIRVEFQGKYLLIRGNRFPDQFQPVGGVYKFNPSALEKFRSWGLRSDDFVPIDEVSADDLRIRVLGRHLPSFLKWFESGKNREQGASREFYEELVHNGPLPASLLPKVRFDFRRRHINKLRYSDFVQCHELLVADIYDLVCTEAQVELIRSATTAHESTFVWVEPDRIKRLGAISGQVQTMKISQTAQWLL
jgi:hypothetical protein